MWWIPPAVALFARAFLFRKERSISGDNKPPRWSSNVPTYNLPPIVLKRKPIETPAAKENSRYKGRWSYVDTYYDFVDVFGPAMRVAEQQFSFAKGIIIGHAAVESAWGQNVIGHNLFNIKASGSPGAYWKGKKINRPSGAYREYDTFQDSIMDYVTMIQNQDNFRAAWNARGNRGKYFDALYAGLGTVSNPILGYFTDSSARGTFKGASSQAASMIA